MAHNYYLINGKHGNGNKVNLLSDGKVTGEFKDISTLDLATLDINFKDKNEILKEYNKDIFMNGIYYDLSYPHNKTEYKIYTPIFDYGNSIIINNYTDDLKYFAEQRKFKVDNKQKIGLDQNKKLDDFIYRAVGHVLRNNNHTISNEESIIAAKLKDLIKEKREEKPYMGVDNYINSRIYILRSIFSNYTQLRSFVIEIIRREADSHIVNRTDLGRVNQWDTNLEANPIVEEECKQITLHDLFPDLVPLPNPINNPKVLKKKR